MSRRVTLVAVVALATPGLAAKGEGQTLEEALGRLRSGAYDSAIAALGALASTGGEASPPLGAEARRTAYVSYLKALTEVGRYGDALEAGERAPQALAVDLANSIGEALYDTGRIEEARAHFDRSWEGRATDRHTARLNRAILEWTYGDREKALAEFDSFIDLYSSVPTISSKELTAVGTAVRYLGRGDSRLYRDALRAYDEAIAADPGNLEPRILVGEMFLEKYNGTEAAQAFQDVLSVNSRHPRALLGMARAKQFNGSLGFTDQIDDALDQNSNLVTARVFKAWLHLEAENHEEARSEIEAALRVNPASLRALSALAASHYLRGERDGYEKVRDRVRELSPAYGEIYNDIAELSVKSRKYREAAELAREAIALDPQSWRGFGILGMNQLRLGQMAEGRANLETAFEGDPYSVWFFNTLALLDSFENYTVFGDDPRFLFVLHNREADVLRPYIEQITSEAFEALVERYGGYTPSLPTRIEVFPSHADFSVRTIGLAGIGALGVSFGPVVAMDSPSAKEPGEFNWASVLWHEMAHVFHLGLSEHRVPRWFSEGLAVHEQRRAKPGWGHQPSPDFLRRFHEGLLLSVSQLNEGFVRPAYPQQVVDSYLMASLVFDYIETRWGFEPILQMLHGYRSGETTKALVERLLGLSMEDLDRDFDEYFRGRFERALRAVEAPRVSAGMGAQHPSTGDLIRLARENPRQFVTRLSAGVALFREGQLDEAEEHLRAAERLFPEYGGNDSPHWYLAQIYRERGETELAAAALERLTSLNESHYQAFLQYAELLGELGDVDGSAQALDGAVLIYPYDIEVHESLARAHAARGDTSGAVREMRAIVALDPPDRAGALYGLARAYLADGRRTEARSAVLRALEIAPNYEEALEFLMELRAGGRP